MAKRRRALRIGWVGFHEEGIPAFSWLAEHGPAPVLLVTLAKSAAEKRSAQARRAYLRLCREHGIPFIEVRNVNDAECVAALRAAKLDLLVVLGWSQILHTEALQTAHIGVVGAHASLLPHNRGSAPINWAVIKGEKETGNTLMWLGEDVDAGDIIDQAAFPITWFDTCATLYAKVAESNRDMLAALLEKLARGERPGRRQPYTGEMLLPRRRPSDGLLRWDRRSETVYNFIRALAAPYPGAFTFLGKKRIAVWKAALLPGSERKGPPGKILGPVVSQVPEACGLEVACGRGSIVLLEIETEAGEKIAGPELSLLKWKNKAFTNG